MNATKKLYSTMNTFNDTRRVNQPRDEPQTSLLPLDEFLYHFYEVISRFKKTDEDLSKVFNLYVIQTKKTKAEVDTFRKAYVDSLSVYGSKDPEAIYILKLLKKIDKEAIDFFMKGKRKVLLFYGLRENNLGQPLSQIPIKISEWINLLKSFSFFGTENLSRKIENFKQFIIEENEDFLSINAAEFLKAVHAFFVYQSQQDAEEIQAVRKGTSRATLATGTSGKEELAFTLPSQALEQRGLTSGKPAQKFRQKTPVILPLLGGKDDQCELNSTQ